MLFITKGGEKYKYWCTKWEKKKRQIEICQVPTGTYALSVILQFYKVFASVLHQNISNT